MNHKSQGTQHIHISYRFYYALLNRRRVLSWFSCNGTVIGRI